MPTLADHHLMLRAMGHDVRITALCLSPDEANVHIEAHPDDGVIAEIAGVIFLANIHDGAPSRRR